MRDRFDHLVSILVFLHITDRRTLFSQCRAVLKVPCGQGVLERAGLRNASSTLCASSPCAAWSEHVH